MSTITGIAQTGLEAASTRLNVSANNVANALTDGFVPSRVSAQEVAGGGVRSTVVKERDPIAEARADAAMLGPSVVSSSGTDLVKEIIDQKAATRLYQANVASLKTADELFQATLSLKA
jgi:flagellar basal-body rod protein FlgC